MNNIRNIEKIIDEEFKLGIYGGLKKGSWHDEYRDSAWVFVGGLSYELSEGDIICVMSQWGEVDDIHLVREKETGKPKGFAFLKYEDARSTILAVDNFNGIKLLGRTLRVDHMDQYRLPAEVKEQELKKLEELEKERKRGKGTRENVNISIEAGHAYRNKELANKYNIQKGVNLWDAKRGLEGEEEEEESDKESDKDEKKRKKHKNKEEKKKKKHRDEKKERKEKSAIDNVKSGSQDEGKERSKKRSREGENTEQKDQKEKKEKKHRSQKEDDRPEKKIKVKKERTSSSSSSKGDYVEDEEDDYPPVKSEPVDYQQLHLKHTIPYSSSLPEGVVASWRGVRDPELHKTAETYEMKKKQTEYLAKQKELFPNKTGNDETSKDEIGGIGGYKRIR
jgi:RNA-binding motif X-linked protein 2